MELFKDIPGYEGLYQITSWGRVWSIKRKKFIRQELTEKGYRRVDINVHEKRRHYKVHRLVAQAFLEDYSEDLQVNHRDGNKENNSITNLEMVTDSENKEHRKRILGIKNA